MLFHRGLWHGAALEEKSTLWGIAFILAARRMKTGPIVVARIGGVQRANTR